MIECRACLLFYNRVGLMLCQIVYYVDIECPNRLAGAVRYAHPHRKEAIHNMTPPSCHRTIVHCPVVIADERVKWSGLFKGTGCSLANLEAFSSMTPKSKMDWKPVSWGSTMRTQQAWKWFNNRPECGWLRRRLQWDFIQQHNLLCNLTK